jgi:hypothetical protein
MKEKELQRKREREQRVELRKRKIERETVEDDLDRSGFESRHKKSEEVSSKDGAATKRRRSVEKKNILGQNLTILFSLRPCHRKSLIVNWGCVEIGLNYAD